MGTVRCDGWLGGNKACTAAAAAPTAIVALVLALALASTVASADGQTDPELKNVVAAAIKAGECFPTSTTRRSGTS
ncbi:MAG: hypothetical protein HC872_09575 [Gammaproteobacteria bacterium]|nr:hypothetical protein [Gammaproteobacteria bacterium]